MGKGGPKQVKRQRHSPEQIIRKLRTAEQMLSEGKTIGETAKALEVSEQTPAPLAKPIRRDEGRRRQTAE
jgi:hypothetical protein